MAFTPVDYIASYFGWNQFTPALPNFYWDVYSAEERVKKICFELDKLCNYANMLGENINIDHNLIDELQKALANIEHLDEIDAQVKLLQETADLIQETLDSLPSYDEFLTLRQDVDNNTENKLVWPALPNSKFGTDGQVLRTNGDGTTQWQAPLIPTDQQANTYITAWLNAHPEATTTVQDNSLTTAKYQDGSVTAPKTGNDVLAYRGAIAADTDLNTIVDSGYYRIPLAISSTLINKPYADLTGVSTLYVFRKAYSGVNVSLQIYECASGPEDRQIWIRAINNTTQSDISGLNWNQIGGSIANATGTSPYKPVSQALLTNALMSYIGGARTNLPANTDLNTLKTTHMYCFGFDITPTLINAPTQVPNQTGGLLVLDGFHGSGNIVTQILMIYSNQDLYFYFRSINKTTGNPLSGFDWKLAFGSMSNSTGNSEVKTMTQKAITDAIDASNSNFLTLKDKQIVIFGDSRTWYDGKTYGDTTKEEWRGQTCVGYQSKVKTIIENNNIINQGVSGNTTVQIATRIKAYDFTNIDVLIIAGGVNDFVKASQVTIGSIAPIGSTFDTDTAYGALQSAIEQVLAAKPSMKIYIIVPAIAWVGGNVFPYATAKVRADIAELYHIPCLNLYNNAGITEINRNYFYADDPSLTNDWYLHFNDNGNAWIGTIIGKYLNSI